MEHYLALKASAGSGKTFALTVRYITLLLHGARPQEILTLTFTNKAANEMSERIYKTLLDLGNNEDYLNEIIKESNFSKEQIILKKDQLIKEYENANLSIFTIDKFVNKILREFCGYIGLSDDFEIKEDDGEALSNKFLQSLNIDQFDKLIDFSLYEEKKYSSLFELFKKLLEKNEDIKIVEVDTKLLDLQKDEIMKYAYKMKEYILNCNDASISSKKAIDFNSFNELLVKGKTWLAKDVTTDFRDFKKCSNETFENYFQELKKQLVNYYKIRSGFSLSKLYSLFKLFKDYKTSYNKSKNYLYFDDISNLTYELLSSKIDKDFLYFRLDSRFSHILIDEFQDTSLLQYKILKPLIDEILSSQDSFQTFFYVGDTKQSIYRFRGGKRELFDYVLKQNPEITEKVLNTNYRSCANIVDFVNNSFEKLSNYEYHTQKSNSNGGYIKVFEDDNLLGEDRYSNISKEISRLMQNGINSNDIAILTYTNEDVLNIYSYLKKMFPSLKISTEMTSKLINQENVSAVINAIKYLYFKEDIYKENLNAIIGNQPNSDINIEVDIKNDSLQDIIYSIADQLKLIDENVIRIIEQSSSFKNIVEFIYDIDKLDTSIENSEKVGLQILTIFKSKGLEFHTVLLLDRIKQKNSDKSSLLFEYEDIFLDNIYYKISGMENYNESYKKALEKEKILNYEDELNILYVAMTRAKSNMIIFKKKEKSVFDLIGLKVEEKGNLCKIENKNKNFEKNQKVIYKALNLGHQEKPVLASSEDDDYSLHAKYFGIATHYCLEMMQNFDEQSLDYSLNLVKNRYSIYLNEIDFQSIRKRVLNLIKNVQFKDLIYNATLNKEQALIYKKDLKIIDLLAKKDDKFYIFDYKTTKDELQEHIHQVSHYKKAIKEILSSENVDSYIIYLNENEAKLKLI